MGSVATAILSKLGYRVVAVTGRPPMPTTCGSSARRRSSNGRNSAAGKPLGKERWAGAVDVAGSHVLANVCATTRYRGVVTACGRRGLRFPATVMPFILRGVTLVGIDSVMCPRADRLEAWRRLASDLDVGKLGAISHRSAGDVIPLAGELINGKVRGRVVVDVNA